MTCNPSIPNSADAVSRNAMPAAFPDSAARPEIVKASGSRITAARCDRVMSRMVSFAGLTAVAAMIDRPPRPDPVASTGPVNRYGG
jgi:hypothetical protein